jgi:hypothetical protein
MPTGDINPNEYSLDLVYADGAHKVQGFMPGTSLTIVYDAQNFNFLQGSDEESARVLLNNSSVLITAILMQSSESNDRLSALSNIDRSVGTGAFSLSFKDNWGKTAGASAVAWIEKIPDQGFDFGQEATIQPRSWAIRCAAYFGTVGSSRRVSA